MVKNNFNFISFLKKSNSRFFFSKFFFNSRFSGLFSGIFLDTKKNKNLSKRKGSLSFKDFFFLDFGFKRGFYLDYFFKHYYKIFKNNGGFFIFYKNSLKTNDISVLDIKKDFFFYDQNLFLRSLFFFKLYKARRIFSLKNSIDLFFRFFSLNFFLKI